MEEISTKAQESRSKWYGHVMRREEECADKRVMFMDMPGKRGQGRRLKRSWMDSIKHDSTENLKGMNGEEVQDRMYDLSKTSKTNKSWKIC